MQPLSTLKKILLIACIALGLLVAGYYEYSTLDAQGVFDLKITHDNLVSNFVENETAFEDVITYFKQQVTATEEEDITFEKGKDDSVTIIIASWPQSRNAFDQPIGSPHLDSVLSVLGWTNETIKTLSEKISKTRCTCIRRSQLYEGYATEIWPIQLDLASYTYYIPDSLSVDSEQKVHGPALSNTDFGKRAFLDYSDGL